MTRTHYAIVDDQGKPATKRQQARCGTEQCE